MSRKKSLSDFWKNKKEREGILERASQLRLDPSQLALLHGDPGIRAALQNARLVSLLPPVGTEVFRRFVPTSLGDVEQQQDAEQDKQAIQKKQNKEAKKDPGKPSSDLEAGKPLPFIYGDPPHELLYTPLEELDPYYQSQKTFIVLGRGNILHRFSAEPVFFMLKPFNPQRRAAIKILTHSLLRLFIMVTILTCCMFMVMSDPPTWSRTVRLVCAVIFTCEAVLKIVSRGLWFGNFTFLKDPWNWLDVIVVTVGFLLVAVDWRLLHVLWTVSLALKLIPVTPGLKATFGAFVQTVGRLTGVFMFVLFCLMVLATISLTIFMGSPRNKCVRNLWASNQSTSDIFSFDSYSPFDNTSETSDGFNFNDCINDPENHYHVPLDQPQLLLCGNSSDAGICSDGYICIRTGTNPDSGLTNFDWFGGSLLAMFRLMTWDNWEPLATMILRTEGISHGFIFMFFIFPSCFFLLCLILAVIAKACGEREEVSVAEAKQKEDVFCQILEALKKREEEEKAACGTELSEKQTNGNGTAVEESGPQRSCCPCWFTCSNVLLKWNCCGCWRGLKQWLSAFITNPFFDLGIVVCLIINIIFMSMEHYPMTMEFEVTISSAELFFIAIYATEQLLKLLAMDPYGYYQVKWNIFESIIVVFSLLEFVLADIGGFSVFRLMRLLRVFRLARWWPSFHMFLMMVWTSMKVLGNFILLLLIMIFIYTVTAVQIYKTYYECDPEDDCLDTHWHMYDYFHAFVLIARVLSGQWFDTLLDVMEQTGQSFLIFLLVVVVIGNLLVLTLFLTLLMSWFNRDYLVENEKNNCHIAVNQILQHISTLRGRKNHVKQGDTDKSEEDMKKEHLALECVAADENLGDRPISDSCRVPMATAEVEFELKTQENKEEKNGDGVQKHLEDRPDTKDHRGHTPEDCCECYRCCPVLNVDMSQGTGKVWCNFRRACLVIIQHAYFEAFIITNIVASFLLLMFEGMYVPKAILEPADLVITFVFLLEMLLKWLGLGMKKYFSSAWCWLDFLILDVSLICLMANALGVHHLGVFQTLRATAPLRVLSRYDGTKVVVQFLVRSVPAIADKLLVAMVVWLVFSISGVNMFAGKFYRCVEESPPRLSMHLHNKTDCFAEIMENNTDVRWRNLKLNFDSVANGYVSLLHLAASGDVMDLRFAAVDSTQVESQPSFESSLYVHLYFICFSIVSFFVLNFLIRGFIDNLQRDKDAGKHTLMTDVQQKYTMVLRRQFLTKPQAPTPWPLTQCCPGLYVFVTSIYYEVFMVVVICLNMLPLMVESAQQSAEAEEILHWTNLFFFLVFFIEFILKIIAFRCSYFTCKWNILDFIVLILYIIGLFIADLFWVYFVGFGLCPTIRLVRIWRIRHLFPKGIKKLLLALTMSLPAVYNISFVLIVLMFTYSSFGVFNFAHVKREHMIDEVINFETFGSSFFSVFLTTTSSNWGGLLEPIMNRPPDCDPFAENPGLTVEGNCGSPTLGIFFFSSYIILYVLLVLHLYISVILQVLNTEDPEVLHDTDLQQFYETWRRFDPSATQFIQYSELSEFCDALEGPLRIPKPNTIKLIQMDLPLYPEDKIHYMDIFSSVSALASDELRDMDELKSRMKKVFMSKSSEVLTEPISSTMRRRQEEVAAAVIQRAARRFLQREDTEVTTEQVVDG